MSKYIRTHNIETIKEEIKKFGFIPDLKIDFNYKSFNCVDDVIKEVDNVIDKRKYTHYLVGVKLTDRETRWKEVFPDSDVWEDYEVYNNVHLTFSEMERVPRWIPNFKDNELPKVTRYHWLDSDKVKDDFVRIANSGKKISVRSGLLTEIKTVQGFWYGKPWMDWEGKLNFVALLEYKEEAVFYVDTVESKQKPEIGMRVTAHHGIGFLTDETRSVSEMVSSVIHYERGTICASLKNEWLNVPVTLEVTGKIERSFRMNVYSMDGFDGVRHVNKIDKHVSSAEDTGVHFDDLTSERKKSGRLFHELFLSDVKVEKIFVIEGSLTKKELKKVHKLGAQYGIPVENAPIEAYSICYCS